MVRQVEEQEGEGEVKEEVVEEMGDDIDKSNDEG
jgi:hypothetical protein